MHLNENNHTRTSTHTLRTDTTNNQAQTQKPGNTDCDMPGCFTQPGGKPVTPECDGPDCLTQPGGIGSPGEMMAYQPRTRNPKVRKSAATTDHTKNTFFQQGAIVFCVTVTKLVIIIH